MSKLERLKDLLRGPRPDSPLDKEPLSQTENQILATGLNFHLEGVPWWSTAQMLDRLTDEKIIDDSGRSGVHSGLARLQLKKFLDYCWGEEEARKMKYYRVNEDGRKRRGKVEEKETSDIGVSVPVPQDSISSR